MIDCKKHQIAFRATGDTIEKLNDILSALRESHPSAKVNISDAIRHAICEYWQFDRQQFKTDIAVAQSVQQLEEIAQAKVAPKQTPARPRKSKKAKKAKDAAA